MDLASSQESKIGSSPVQASKRQSFNFSSSQAFSLNLAFKRWKYFFTNQTSRSLRIHLIYLRYWGHLRVILDLPFLQDWCQPTVFRGA